MHSAYSDSIGAPKVPSVSWKDVGGLEPLKKEILRSLKSNMFSTGLKRSGMKICQSVVRYIFINKQKLKSFL